MCSVKENAKYRAESRELRVAKSGKSKDESSWYQEAM